MFSGYDWRVRFCDATKNVFQINCIWWNFLFSSYYRAKLDYSNRLLLQFAHHAGETVCLALEVIENHAYDKSRFLRGAPVDEATYRTRPPAAVALLNDRLASVADKF